MLRSAIRSNKLNLLWLILFIVYLFDSIRPLFNNNIPELKNLFFCAVNLNLLLYGVFHQSNYIIDKPQAGEPNSIAAAHFWISILRTVVILIGACFWVIKVFTKHDISEIAYLLITLPIILDSVLLIYRAITKQLTIT